MDPITLLLLFGSGYLAKKITDKSPSVSKATKGYEIIEKDKSITLKIVNEKQAFDWAYNYGKTIYDKKLKYDTINKILFNDNFEKIVNENNLNFLNNLINSLLKGNIAHINSNKILINDYYKIIHNYYLHYLFYEMTYAFAGTLGNFFLPPINIINKGYNINGCEFVPNDTINVGGFGFTKFTKILSEIISEKNEDPDEDFDIEELQKMFNNIIFENCDETQRIIDPIDNYLLYRSFLQGLVINEIIDPGSAGETLTDRLGELRDNYEFSPNNKIHLQQVEKLNLLTDSIYDPEII